MIAPIPSDGDPLEDALRLLEEMDRPAGDGEGDASDGDDTDGEGDALIASELLGDAADETLAG
jgi:hypothetical protein